MKKITRKQAVLNLQCLFDDFFKTYFRAPKEAIDETLDNARFYEQKEKLRKPSIPQNTAQYSVSWTARASGSITKRSENSQRHIKST